VTATVGLIVHCGAAQDVRRLTSLARTIDLHERVNVVARVLAGLAATPSVRVRYLHEPTRIVERALTVLAASGARGPVDAHPAGPPSARDAAGTRAAATALGDEGAACIVTYGGDGTNRAVAAGWPDAVIVPLPGGTNNAFARSVDPTAAGLAAGLYATGPGRFAASAHATPHLSIALDGRPAEIAICDAALVTDRWVGAHAIWDPSHLLEAVVLHGDPAGVGLCGVAGMLMPADRARPRGVHLRFGAPGRTILAHIGPGRLVPLSIRDVAPLERGEAIQMRGPGTIALDGEREIVLAHREPASVRVADDGLRVLDAAGLLRAHARDSPPAAVITNDTRQATPGGS
jgi:Diacylglycerol kinase catalytic domain